ncbi:MAG TPA: hypothetical protein VK125_05830 [Bacillota bacterium]|nr:hypothetical protein [Bacillota bacterium]
MNDKQSFKEDQASDLKQMFDEINQNERKDETVDSSKERERNQIDILNLPPRKEVHSNNTTFKITINRSLLRMVFVVIILVVLLVFYLWEDEVLELLNNLGIIGNS